MDPQKLIAAARKCLLVEAQKPNSRLTASDVLGMTDSRAVAEAMSTSDFPLLMADPARASLIQSYESEKGPLTALLPPQLVADFAEHRGIQIGNLGQLKELKGEMIEAPEFTAITEAGTTYRLKAWARRFAFTLKVLANDRLGALAQVPQSWGQVAAESIEAQLAVPFNTNKEQDGATNIWSGARGNCGVLPLTEGNVSLSIAALKAMTYADADKTTHKIPCRKILLLVPDSLAETAWKIWTATKYFPGAAGGIEYDPKEIWRNFGWSTPPITVPDLSDTNRWFLVNASRPWFKKVLWMQAQQPVLVQKRPYWDANVGGFPVDENLSAEWGCYFFYHYYVEDYRTIRAEDSDNPW